MLAVEPPGGLDSERLVAVNNWWLGAPGGCE